MDHIHSAEGTAANETLVQHMLDYFKLTPDQRLAAGARGQDIAVTAGAGSGKTRTLVARYLSLLAEGASPRRVVAITFTEKAAREMRSRVREAVNEQAAGAADAETRRRWSDLEANLDAARIGTIHSLCAEILRAHPAEAGVDPRFEVLEEGLAATLRLQAIEDSLAWLVGDQPAAQFAPLLAGLTTRGLTALLAFLLDHRLEAQEAFQRFGDPSSCLQQTLQTALSQPCLAEPLAGLRRLQAAKTLRADAGDKLAPQVEGLLATWDQAEQALAAGDWAEAAVRLFQARRSMVGRAGSASSQAKGLLGELRAAYGDWLDPWLGGSQSQDLAPDLAVEGWFAQALPLVCQVFDHLLQAYQAALRQRQALDFDDLEAGAVLLLRRPEIGSLWQQEVTALLVDEFQDTNARQREIVQRLCGPQPGRLFVVGDARQSIYRFRRADVTVFRQLKQEIQTRGGLVVDLNLTYRAHTALLAAAGDLLARVMGDQPDPERPYFVPFAPLYSDHAAPRSRAQAPFVEFILGGGPEADVARPAAAGALAQRLLELRQAGQIGRWDEVALLFRASTGFPAYEEAFEARGIPFVTVAGQGFYNRPEIRDVLNLLRALADPWDDLALAGLLRSPAFGLSDAALYQLRWTGAAAQPYWIALQGDLGRLDEADQGYARRARSILDELLPLVDTLPVADLLKRLVDRVDYRAILASAGCVKDGIEKAGGAGRAGGLSGTGGERLWRNLDKLLADAQSSRMVNLRRFLEYLDSLRDVGAREGEAPAEAEGALRLMTIHKAKGLEFPVVVLADAARRPRHAAAPAYLLPELGLAFKPDRSETPPLLHRLASCQDGRQGQAEEKRLLYVALTRAKEKLLISGHCSAAQSGWRTDGWLAELAQAAGIDLAAAFDAGQPLEAATPGGHPVRVWARLDEIPPVVNAAPALTAWPELPGAPLYQALETATPQAPTADTASAAALDPEPAELRRPWRATGERMHPPAEAIGRLVHQAIQRWLFPTQAQFSHYLDRAALEIGLADPAQRLEAIDIAAGLLARLQRHPLWQEIEHSLERHHEAPYSHLVANRPDSGYIDLLYRTGQGWHIVDFKTDSLRSPAERQATVERYAAQMQRYARAVQGLLRQPVQVRLCFLDDQGQVSLESCP